MACGLKEGAGARTPTRSRVLLGHGGEEGPDGRGPRGSERERGGGASRLGCRFGPGRWSWAGWERKKMGRGKEWACWAETERGKMKAFLFLKGFKHIQFKFEFKNSNLN